MAVAGEFAPASKRGKKPARPGAPRLLRLPGLDGLRGIAVAGVIVYHLNPSWLPGGYLGVDLFFVISGYLITSLLLLEGQSTGQVALRRFWGRRARRLFPALAFLLCALILLSSVVARDSLSRLRADLPFVLVYSMNWRLVFHHDSYAASLGRPPLLLHLWSLAIEEQFYLLWPFALSFLRRRLPIRRVAEVSVGGAFLSALLMAVLFVPGSDPSGVYFSTETHAEGLLIGGALAAFAPPWHLRTAVTPGARRLLDWAGAASLAAAVVGLATLGFYSTATYRGGLLGFDLACGLLVGIAAHPASRLGSRLARQPLAWLGLRSYSLYLWHWPIFQMTRPGTDLPWTGWSAQLLRLGLTAGAAELSYRWVEQPWRSGRAQDALRRLATSAPRLGLSAPPAVLVGLLVSLLATAPAPKVPAVLAAGSTPAARGRPVEPAGDASLALRAGKEPTTGATAGWAKALLAVPSTSGVSASGPTTTSSPTTAGQPPAPADPVASQEPILAIGDSVLLAAGPALEATFGSQITVDADVGRHVNQGIARLAAYRSSGALSRYRTLVVDLGTNGTFDQAEFTQLVQMAAGVPRVVVFDVHADRPWTAGDNAVIKAGVAAHPAQMVLADWDHAVAPGLLYSDGIHPNPAGARVYARLLQSTLISPLASPTPTHGPAPAQIPTPETAAERLLEARVIHLEEWFDRLARPSG